MWPPSDELEGLRKIIEVEQDIQETLSSNQEAKRIIRTLYEGSEQHQRAAEAIKDARATQIQATAAINLGVEYKAIIESLQEPLIPPETIRAISEAVEPIAQLTTDLANNQAFLDAMEASVTMRTSLDELALLFSSTGRTQQSIDEPEFDDVTPTSPQRTTSTAIIYEQTVNPYQPIQEDLNRFQSTISGYIWAAVSDSGELSSDLSEEEKKAIRLGLAITVGLILGTLLGVTVGTGAGLLLGMNYGIISGTTTGLTSGIGTSRWFSNEFDKWYDMKQRQDPSEDDSE